MTENASIRPIIRALEAAAYDRAASDGVASRKNHVAWRIQRNGWFTMRKCSATVYAPGCIRFRNDLSFDVPRRVWPLRPVEYDMSGRMEITIHESEVETLLPLIVQIAEDAKKDYPNELFPDGRITPSYCWSIKAKAHYDAQHVRGRVS